MNQYVEQILHNPLASLAIVGNLVIIESLLSVDNAAVLATMVGDLPKVEKRLSLDDFMDARASAGLRSSIRLLRPGATCSPSGVSITIRIDDGVPWVL